MRIAVLEDDAEQNRFLTAVLSAAGYSVHTFMNGRALAAKLTHESFDLLILDWQVPDLSGYEVLRKVRAQFGNQTPVLFITHRDAEEDIVLALQAGADDYVVKPPRPQEIIARVAALIRPCLRSLSICHRTASNRTRARSQSMASPSISHRRSSISRSFFFGIARSSFRATTSSR